MPRPIVRIVRKLAGLPGPGDDFWFEPIGAASATGIQVTATSALAFPAVYACVRVLAETIASLPLIVYRRLPNGEKQRAENHPLFDLLHDQPNQWQTAFEFTEMMQGHLELRGNAYAEIIPGPRGFADQLIPLHPDRVEVEVLKSRQLNYRFRDRDGSRRDIDQDAMHHLRGWTTNGFTGMSPISIEAEAVAMGLSAQEYGARFFQNDARPGGVLEHPTKLTQGSQDRLTESWQKAHSGKERHKVAVLEEGLKYHELGITNKDAQFLESREFQAEEIARIFRVPPHKIGLMKRSTFSNIEHQSIEFVTDSILPRLRRNEQAIKRDLIIAKKTFFAEYLIDALLRGDINSRYAAFAIARQWGWLSVNEIRRFENMNPIEGGDSYLTPMNMQPVAMKDLSDERLATIFTMMGDSGHNGRGEAS